MSENGNLPGGRCKEGNKWKRMHIKSATGEKSGKNMEKCAYIVQDTTNGYVLG